MALLGLVDGDMMPCIELVLSLSRNDVPEVTCKVWLLRGEFIPDIGISIVC